MTRESLRRCENGGLHVTIVCMHWCATWPLKALHDPATTCFAGYFVVVAVAVRCSIIRGVDKDEFREGVSCWTFLLLFTTPSTAYSWSCDCPLTADDFFVFFFFF